MVKWCVSFPGKINYQIFINLKCQKHKIKMENLFVRSDRLYTRH